MGFVILLLAPNPLVQKVAQRTAAAAPALYIAVFAHASMFLNALYGTLSDYSPNKL